MECLVIQFGPGAKTASTTRPVSRRDTIYKSRSSTLDDANAGQSRACQSKKDRSAIYTVINIQQMLRSRDAVNTFGWIFFHVVGFAAGFGARAKVRQPQHARSRGQTAAVAALRS